MSPGVVACPPVARVSDASMASLYLLAAASIGLVGHPVCDGCASSTSQRSLPCSGSAAVERGLGSTLPRLRDGWPVVQDRQGARGVRSHTATISSLVALDRRVTPWYPAALSRDSKYLTTLPGLFNALSLMSPPTSAFVNNSNSRAVGRTNHTHHPSCWRTSATDVASGRNDMETLTTATALLESSGLLGRRSRSGRAGLTRPSRRLSPAGTSPRVHDRQGSGRLRAGWSKSCPDQRSCQR